VRKLHIIRFTVFVIFLALLLSVALTPALAQEATPAATPTIIVAAAWQPGLLTVDANTTADFDMNPGEATLRVLQAGTYPVQVDANSQADWLHIKMQDGIEGYIASASNVTLSPIPPTAAPVEQPPVTVNIEQPPAAESPAFSPAEIVLIVVIVFLCIIIGLKEVNLRDYIRQAFASVPPEGRLLISDGGARLLSEGQKLVDASPNTIDDAAYAMLKPMLLRLLQEVQTTPSAAVNMTLVPPSASPQG